MNIDDLKTQSIDLLHGDGVPTKAGIDKLSRSKNSIKYGQRSAKLTVWQCFSWNFMLRPSA
ncbi:hypothetical protein QUF90_18750 [Desulfococcaceae bacterium HSG9]|nr:hypothetical protein [Desulfococcaceae bacterium HSG9]